MSLVNHIYPDRSDCLKSNHVTHNPDLVYSLFVYQVSTPIGLNTPCNGPIIDFVLTVLCVLHIERKTTNIIQTSPVCLWPVLYIPAMTSITHSQAWPRPALHSQRMGVLSLHGDMKIPFELQALAELQIIPYSPSSEKCFSLHFHGLIRDLCR
ncbi:hypothetical protein AGOR_G00075210 [Albula goreensis]|uniref:Uncharacterized protein n=1 Tax=Albula goreensis TaxID=1534307 RepID=A0A8T3DSE1_9TELE|nr:hypothetical protein AGOR_G00075210 [Albula goreensis]